MATHGRTFRLFTNTSTGAEPGDEAAHKNSTQATGYEAIAQVSLTNFTGDTFSLEIQGRLNDSLPWGELVSITEADINSNGSGFVAFRMVPHLRVETLALSSVGVGHLTVDVMN